MSEIDFSQQREFILVVYEDAVFFLFGISLRIALKRLGLLRLVFLDINFAGLEVKLELSNILPVVVCDFGEINICGHIWLGFNLGSCNMGLLGCLSSFLEDFLVSQSVDIFLWFFRFTKVTNNQRVHRFSDRSYFCLATFYRDFSIFF